MKQKIVNILICLGFGTITFFACTGARYAMNPPKHHPYPQQRMQQLKEPSSEQFRRMIIQNIQPYIGSDTADKSPAIAVGLVTRKGDVTVTMGARDIFTGMPPDGNTLFGIGSISKLFTGLILANAVVNKDLSLSNKANDFLEKEMQIDDRITLRHLVTHFSGLPKFPDNIMERKQRFKNQENARLMPAQNYSQKDLENCLANNQCRPVNPPGKSYLYSNLGIGILSIVLQNRYGYTDFNSLNQAKITNVLNMDKTSTNNSDFMEKNRKNLAQGYQYNKKLRQFKPVPFSDMGILAGSGELISNVNNMNVLLKLMTGLSINPMENAVKELEQELENTDQPGIRKAYAHRVRQAQDGGSIHFKSGLTAGYSAIILWRKNPEVGLILLSNRGKFDPLLLLSQRLMGRVTQQLKQ